ncbi:MAG: YMGG-like glycine zipper-containing protein [Deltaproteobacteria bacterium]|nr:YMGG-like glycine zipper-containing protein [Deltaproteobacteria bacterium]
MRKIVSLATIAALFVSILSGCAAQNGGMREHRGAAVGAGTGAVGGAVVGGLLGGKRGAVVGGLLGALAGGLVGNYHDQREKTLAETRRIYTGYNPARGTRLKIERVRTNPPTAAPGDTVEIQLTYAVLTPREDVMVAVRESREILFNGSKVGEASVDIEREGGTWRSVVPITLPGNARPGNYRVVASVESRGGGKDIEEIMFRVHR